MYIDLNEEEDRPSPLSLSSSVHSFDRLGLLFFIFGFSTSLALTIAQGTEPIIIMTGSRDDDDGTEGAERVIAALAGVTGQDDDDGGDKVGQQGRKAKKTVQCNVMSSLTRDGVTRLLFM